MADVNNTIEEGEIPASTNAPTYDTVKRNRNSKVLLFTAIAVASILALGFGLGFGLPRDDKNNSSDTNNSLEGGGGNELISTGNVNNSTGDDDSDDTDTPSNTTNPIGGETTPVTFATRLSAISDDTIKQTYSSCDSLQNDLRLLGRMIANRTIDGNEWYFDQSNTYMNEDPDGTIIADETTPATGELADTPGETSTPKGVSESNYGTNNQVEGVEEGDLVQSNGQQVFVVYGTDIVELAADAVTITSRTTIPTEATEGCSLGYIPTMLLIDDRLVVVATSYCNTDVVVNGDTSTSSSSDISYLGQDTSNVYVYDTADMSLVETVSLKGSFISARAIGVNVHVVTSTYLDSYAFTQYFEPWREDIYGVNVTKAQYRAKAQEQADEHLQEYVEDMSQRLDCGSLQKLALFQNSDVELKFSSTLDTIATVTSFVANDAEASKSVASMMLPSGGYTTYASADYLILAVQGWWLDDAATQQTYLVSYKLNGPTSNVTSLGTVPGYILNQFSIDHHVQDGEQYLRVASTTLAQWAEVNNVWMESTNSTSQVTILKMDNDSSQMSVVGTVKNLGKDGETIYSVRFMGDRGFVTTFEVIDPFYTLDLSDPSNPLKAGELEIPGYSSYLHPVGNNLIIGIGQATDSNGTTLGVQISLFDVSSFSNPVRIQSFSDVGSSNMSSASYSEAEYDHKAFRYLNESQLLIIPMTIYNYSPCNYTFVDDPIGLETGNATTTDGSESVDSEIFIDPVPGPCYEPSGGYDGFRVYEVKADGIASYLSVQHDIGDWFTSCWSGAFLPTRSLVFDGDLMTLKSHSILSHDLSTLAEDASPINLDDGNTVCEPYILF